MENEEQHHHHQYGGGGGEGNNNNTSMGDLRHLFSPEPLLPPKASLYRPPPLPPPHHTLFSAASTGGGAFTPLHYPHQYEMMLTMGGGVNPAGDFHSDSTTTTASAATAIPAACNVGRSGSGGGFGVEDAAGSSGFGGEGTARWPRQETLTLLEVRSRLHLQFKEANHKAPLWDQVSRIMCDEHGYQRSGKKCREKFENLYKYYKKTKDGKAGRHDGKHYRFFRQLEALLGETEPNSSHLNISSPNNNNNTSIHHQFHSAMPNSHCGGGSHSISLSDNPSSELHLSASVDNDLNGAGLIEEGGGKKRRGKHILKSKIKSFIDLQMRKVMEKQEAWLEKMMRTLEHKEKERVLREEERRSHDSGRMEREHNLWADERAWIEGRDRALMNALHKLTGKELAVEDLLSTSHDRSEELHMMRENNRVGDRWSESEITELIRLKANMDARLEQCGGSLKEGSLWEEITTRITSLGYDHRTATMCKEKYWDLINAGHMKSKEWHKKSKEDWRIKSDDCSNSSSHHQHLHTSESNRLYGYGGEINGPRGMGPVPPEISLGGGLNPMSDSFKFLLGNDGDSHLPASYGLKLNKVK